MKKYLSEYGDLLIRVVVGLIFVFAGFGKLTGISGFASMLANMGFPASNFFAYLVAIIEFFGGLMLIFGIWTSVVAPLLAIIIVVAIITVHMPQGWNGIKYPLLVLVVLIRYIGTSGFGSLTNLFGKKHTK